MTAPRFDGTIVDDPYPYDLGYRDGAVAATRTAIAFVRHMADGPGLRPFTRQELRYIADKLEPVADDIAAGRRTINPSGKLEPAP